MAILEFKPKNKPPQNPAIMPRSPGPAKNRLFHYRLWRNVGAAPFIARERNAKSVAYGWGD